MHLDTPQCFSAEMYSADLDIQGKPEDDKVFTILIISDAFCGVIDTSFLVYGIEVNFVICHKCNYVDPKIILCLCLFVLFNIFAFTIKVSVVY